MTVSLASLIVAQTKTQIYDFAIGIATAIGLPVTSWQEGDPTRSQFHVESESLATLETTVVGWIQSRFLDLATGDWLKVKAEQDYDVTVPEATYATCDVAMSNPTGFVFTDIAAGDLTFKNTTTGKTYHNTTGGTLGAKVGIVNGTLSVTVVADEAGSDSSASAGEIDDMVTTLDGAVTCTNALAAIGIDEQDEATTRIQCRDKLGSLSPDGPKEAYSYVARNPDLALTNACTRCRVYGDSDTGDVTVYLAGPAGGVSAADRTLIETAILTWATPLCITPTVLAATNVTVAVTYELWLYKRANKTAAEAAADIATALETLFASLPIGGDIISPATTGKLYQSLVAATIRGVFPTDAFRVSVTTPSGDTSLTNGQVAALGTVTATVNLVVNP